MKIVSRKDAIAAGERRYFTGVPCRHGHLDFRFVSNSACLSCSAGWQSQNPEKRRKANREWYARNTTKERARAIKKRWDSIDDYRAYAKDYNGKNLDRLAAIARNRRARAKKSGGKHTVDDIKDIFRLQHGKCACCRVDLTLRTSHVDHIVPIARGGENGRRNLSDYVRYLQQT